MPFAIIASMVSTTSCSLMSSPKLFQLLQPIGGVSARPLLFGAGGAAAGTALDINHPVASTTDTAMILFSVTAAPFLLKLRRRAEQVRATPGFETHQHVGPAQVREIVVIQQIAPFERHRDDLVELVCHRG